jgi:YD repeat-containing protein
MAQEIKRTYKQYLMKWHRILFLFFLIPVLAYGFDQSQSKQLRDQAFAEWDRHIELYNDYKNFGADLEGHGLHRVKEALYCCQRALSLTDKNLKKIAKLSKEDRKSDWWAGQKDACEKDRQTAIDEIAALEKEIDQILSSMAFQKAKILYEESLKIASQAQNVHNECPSRTLINSDVVVSHLSRVAVLYRKATSLAKTAHETLLTAPHYDEASKATLEKTSETYALTAVSIEKEAREWPEKAVEQKNALKKRLETLKRDSRLFEEKSLMRSCYEMQKQALPILKTLIQNSEGEEKENFESELERLKTSIAQFEEAADQNRLTENTLSLSVQAFKLEEDARREAFFKGDLKLDPSLFLQTVLNPTSRPCAIPLDGIGGKKGDEFILYEAQLYRFLVQSDFSVSSLRVQVSKDGNLVHEETISLPTKNTESWQRYLTADGMVFHPETKLKQDFGLDLRLHFVCDPECPFSMIIATSATQTDLQVSFSLDEGPLLLTCSFSPPPPWQLGSLLKPQLSAACKPFKAIENPTLSYKASPAINPSPIETASFPILDQLALELKNDPLLLAQYVTQEIAFVDPFLLEEDGVFQAPSTHRNPLMTYLERRGSPWEQCWLLLYLLRKAGYEAHYAFGEPLSLPKDFAEKLLFTKLPKDQEEALVKYPFVLLKDGEKSIPLFPWMKEIQITEGYDLYNLMPEEYASADKWILRYLKGDENILKHIGPDGNDTTALLFSRFVEEELRKQGLALADVGTHRKQLKRQFSSWKDFPKPKILGTPQTFKSLGHVPNVAAFATVDVFSRENPHKKLSSALLLANLSCQAIPIRFAPNGKDGHRLFVQFIGEDKEQSIDLDATDKIIDIKVSYAAPVGSQYYQAIQTRPIAKGTEAALCFHFGGATSYKTTESHKQFSLEKDENKKLQLLLNFVGTAYFEKCSYGEELLADLHKISSRTMFAFGVAKISPDLSKGGISTAQNPSLPQVDMLWFRARLPSYPLPVTWNQEMHSACMQWSALATANLSSNEHQILREIFSDPYAISTVKLLQLAHLEHEKRGGEGEGFLFFTPESFEAADKTPEIAKSLYFPHLKDLDLQNIKKTSPELWEAIQGLFSRDEPISPWGYTYLTPGLISSQNDSYLEAGALILYPYSQWAMISNNNLVFHGGFGSPLPSNYFAPESIRNWELTPTYTGGINHYSLDAFSPQFTSYDLNTSTPIQERVWQTSDIRPENKSIVSHVADPVDTITGAFYIDEIDLALPGHFPLSIRRNYNSQNPVVGNLGAGWKLSLNPYLTEQNGKRFAAEADGSVICYSYNSESDRYEVDPNDNPDLYNFNQHGVGSRASLFHSYIEDSVLYGADGSKRFFDEGLLKKWVNYKGVTLSFFYEDENLSRIESSSGDYLGFHYNHQGNMEEIYAKDGRRISYSYDGEGNLVKVILPSTATITYEYDRRHRIIRETKPHGKILENVYDDKGRVVQQRSPMGQAQAMIPTATFEYADDTTTVTDACGGKTIYKIFDKQIYRVIDPLGNTTLQSWFIDEESYFDAETEQVISWEGAGSFPRSLKSTTDKRGLITSYFYDERGNPIEITLQGEDLTGDGKTTITKNLSYNDFNLCTEEEVQDQKTKTSYDQKFPYLPKRIEKYSNDTLVSSTEFSYDSSAQLIQENHNGSITLWDYDGRGFPIQKTEKTGTNDPDVVTTYLYNIQGQCIKIASIDRVQENAYDIMGNLIQSEVFSPSGKLLSANYVGYNLNNQPIWKQTANETNTLYLDYHASGAIKASRRQEKVQASYTLYEYDPRGYLIEEVDPRGYCTTREYDALGNILKETKEGISTEFTYEAGGLVETITSPTLSQTKRVYTTNGLFREEIYPDGTKTSVVYDFFGKKVQEIINGITWDIIYDDTKSSVIRTHRETGLTEIEEYDAKGNLIRFTDQGGFTTEKTYDDLGRIKTETTPSGEQTTWNYLGNTVLCTLASGEARETRIEGGQIIETKIFDLDGNLTLHWATSYDAESDVETVTQGDIVTTTWINSSSQPIKIQKGSIVETFEYDRCSNCIALIDGEGHTTHQTFDGLGRIIQKQLPDGALLKFDYDLDSNLTKVHFPNGNTWQAAYDSMGRKSSENCSPGGKAHPNGNIPTKMDILHKPKTPWVA